MTTARAAALLACAAAACAPARAMVAPTTRLGSGVRARIPIDESFPGLRRVHADPDVYVIERFLEAADCDDMVARAAPTLQASPVAYAGWTEDFVELLKLAASGPCLWLALVGAWAQSQGHPDFSRVDLVVHTAQNYALTLGVAAAGVGAFTKSRASGLQTLRTSTSTTLDELATAAEPRVCGTTAFVRAAARLLGDGGGGGGGEERGGLAAQAALFEAPTIIRYEPGQALAPHYDANRAAATEDAERGGQTLATLIVYLNDVQRGGLTRFGKLSAPAEAGGDGAQPAAADAPRGFGAKRPRAAARAAAGSADGSLTVTPRKGDALLFFPADAAGGFDERTEHEGCPAVDEKYIARIWRHAGRVRPPYGLSDAQLAKLPPA